MTGRSVPEWIGKTPDSKVPTSVRARVFERHGGVCHISKRKIQAGEKWELEHVRALSMGGEHREGNMAPALVAPHRAKSAQETTDRSKADRIHAKHFGYFPKSKRPLKSKPFDGTAVFKDRS